MASSEAIVLFATDGAVLPVELTTKTLTSQKLGIEWDLTSPDRIQ